MDYIIKNINKVNNNLIDNYNSYKTNINSLINIKKKQSIIGELLLDELLKKNNINKGTIYTNENGKPFFEDNNIYFNISHSNDYVITVISNNEIGVDIEKVKKTHINTINMFATENEKKYILSSNIDIEKRLFKIYTLKEAYIKMYGKRLTDLLSVEFIIDKNNNITCSDKNVTCNFINDIDNYIIAYCEKKKDLI